MGATFGSEVRLRGGETFEVEKFEQMNGNNLGIYLWWVMAVQRVLPIKVLARERNEIETCRYATRFFE